MTSCISIPSIHSRHPLTFGTTFKQTPSSILVKEKLILNHFRKCVTRGRFTENLNFWQQQFTGLPRSFMYRSETTCWKQTTSAGQSSWRSYLYRINREDEKGNQTNISYDLGTKTGCINLGLSHATCSCWSSI